MKRTISIILLIMTMSVINIFADGDTPAGGKTCQQTQTCLINNNENNDDPKDFSLYFLWLKIREDLRIIF